MGDVKRLVLKVPLIDEKTMTQVYVVLNKEGKIITATPRDPWQPHKQMKDVSRQAIRSYLGL